jgi:amino acid transporter
VAVEPAQSSIRARLSTFDTAMVVFSLVVGIGIFRTPAIVAGAAGGTSLFFTAWIAGGLISLIGALTFAEIGSRYPRAGGYYRVVADCYNPARAGGHNHLADRLAAVSPGTTAVRRPAGFPRAAGVTALPGLPRDLGGDDGSYSTACGTA